MTTTAHPPIRPPALPEETPPRGRGRDATKYVSRRLMQGVIVLFLVTLGTQALTNLIPGSPAALILGEGATPATIAALNKQYGFNEPFFERYWTWLDHALHGNLGRSEQSQQTVTYLIRSHLPVTLELAVLALMLSLIVSITLALVCAYRPGRLIDRMMTALASALVSMPFYVTCVVLAIVLSAKLKLFPTFGWVPLTQSVTQNLRYAAMPVLVLVIAITPVFLRVLRGDLVSVLREDFVLSARARGLPDRYILLRHVLRPASLSLFTLAGLVFGSLIGGAIIVENYFELPGIGQAVGQAVTAKDLPVVQGVVVLVAIVFVVVNTLVDIGLVLIDPQAGQRR